MQWKLTGQYIMIIQPPNLGDITKIKELAKHLMIYNVDQDGEILPQTLDITKLDEIAFEIENGNNEIVLVDNGSSSFNPFV